MMIKRIRRYVQIAACLAWMSAGLGATPRPVRADGPTVQQFVRMRWPVAGRLAPDGCLYYIHNPDGLFQLYVRPKGAIDHIKLTDFPDGVASYLLSDDGRYAIVLAGVGGNEQTGIYLLDTATRRLRALMCHPDILYGAPLWRHDSKGFAFRANDVSPADFYVYTYDLAANTTRRVLAEPGDWTPADFSPDGNRLAVLRTHSATYTQLFEIDLADGKKRQLSRAGEEWAFEAVGYTADGKNFLAVSNYKADKNGLVSLDLADGKITRPLSKYDSFELDAGQLRQDRSLLALLVNEDGYSTLHLHKLPGFEEHSAPDLPRGIVGNVSFSGADLLYSLDNANTPGLIYRWPLEAKNPSSLPLTQADTQGIDPSTFRLPELVRYKSFDGLEIPAFLYLPPNYAPGRKIPFIIEYHGGPEAQYRPAFNRFYQYMLTRGFGVLAPNVRGSSGYGTRYLEMDNYKKRMDSVRDGVAAAQWLVDMGYTTPDRIGAFGGSYGGFMVMAVITQAPEMYGAACNIVGICNFQTFLERTRDYRRKLREVEYGPLTDPAFLKSISPIYKVDKIRVPLLIAHGENDPRVPVHEARQLYESMKKLDKPVEILVFPDEGHGFRKENNRITFYEKATEFFEKHLAGPERRALAQ